MNIRDYDESDLRSVAHLFTDSVHGLGWTHYDAAQCHAWAPRPPDLTAWRARLARLHTLVAEEEDGTLAGFLAYEDDAHIDLLFTAPDLARRGVASALYARAESSIAALGAAEAYTEASLIARPFFERQGFRVVEEQVVTRNGVSFRRFAMRKAIPGLEALRTDPKGA